MSASITWCFRVLRIWQLVMSICAIYTSQRQKKSKLFFGESAWHSKDSFSAACLEAALGPLILKALNFLQPQISTYFSYWQSIELGAFFCTKHDFQLTRNDCFKGTALQPERAPPRQMLDFCACSVCSWRSNSKNLLTKKEKKRFRRKLSLRWRGDRSRTFLRYSSIFGELVVCCRRCDTRLRV